MINFPKLFCPAGAALLSVLAHSQTDSSRFKMIQALSTHIKSNYVSADMAARMCDTINWKLSNGKYDHQLNPDEFAFEITKDLRRISHDQHISVSQPEHKPVSDSAYSSRFGSMTPKQLKRFYKKTRKKLKKYITRTKDDMFTYGDIKILPGNIGYVEIKDFASTSWYKKDNKKRIAIRDVMFFLSNTRSIIIDFRDNQGGLVRLAAEFCSFFSPVPNNYFITSEACFRYDSSGTLKETTVANKKFTSGITDNVLTRSKSLYILTSSRTFSAAELSIYTIKRYNPSSTIIGEKTTGGGNGYSGITTEKYFSATIPSLKSYDESNGNYSIEGTGITPDIITSADTAFFVAYSLATKEATPLQTKTRYFKKPARKAALNKTVFRKYYPDYVGDYSKIRIIEEGAGLFMLYDTYRKIQLLPKAVDQFTGDHTQLVKFLRDKNGRVTDVQIKHTREFTEQFKRQ